MPRRSFNRHLYLAPLVAELVARSCEVDARDLAARLLSMRVGDEISVPCCATTALPDRDRRFFHGTSWDGIIGILRQGFIGGVHHDRAQGVPLTYVAAERVMAWRYPDPWRQPTFVIGEGFPRMRFMLECSIPAEGNDWTPGASYSRNKQLGFLPHKVKPVTVIFKAMPNAPAGQAAPGSARRSGGSRPRPSSTPPELQRSGEVARALALHPLGLTLVRHPVIDFDVETAIMNSKLGQLQQVPIDSKDL